MDLVSRAEYEAVAGIFHVKLLKGKNVVIDTLSLVKIKASFQIANSAIFAFNKSGNGILCTRKDDSD